MDVGAAPAPAPYGCRGLAARCLRGDKGKAVRTLGDARGDAPGAPRPGGLRSVCEAQRCPFIRIAFFSMPSLLFGAGVARVFFERLVSLADVFSKHCSLVTTVFLLAPGFTRVL